MSGGGLGRIFVWAAIGLVCLVLVPFVLFSALLGASSAASCGDGAAATPGDLSSLGDLIQGRPGRHAAARDRAADLRGRPSRCRWATTAGSSTAYAVALVESGGGVTMVNVRGGDAGLDRGLPAARHPALEPAQPKQRLGGLDQLLRGAPRLRPRPVDRRARRRHPAARARIYRFKYALAVPRARYFLAKVKGGPLPPAEGLGSITATGTELRRPGRAPRQGQDRQGQRPGPAGERAAARRQGDRGRQPDQRAALRLGRGPRRLVEPARL